MGARRKTDNKIVADDEATNAQQTGRQKEIAFIKEQSKPLWKGGGELAGGRGEDVQETRTRRQEKSNARLSRRAIVCNGLPKASANPYTNQPTIYSPPSRPRVISPIQRARGENDWNLLLRVLLRFPRNCFIIPDLYSPLAAGASAATLSPPFHALLSLPRVRPQPARRAFENDVPVP